MNNVVDPKDFIVHFKFNCFKCNTDFPIYLGYLKNKQEVECPNCGQKLPNEVLSNLREVTLLLEKSIKSLHMENTNDSGWNLSLSWKNTNSLPPRLDRYDYLSCTSDDEKKSYKPFDLEINYQQITDDSSEIDF